MANHLLETEDIGNDLEELILEKTEGIPFYIEEFIKSLKDLNAIEKKNGTYHLAKDLKAVSIPSTIQDVIMARVDKLPEGTKNLLQTGSVIEREFSYELINTVSGLSEQELLPQLSVLKDSELIFERGIYPESTYVFKHALTQEVVYDSILTRRKKELHNKIGQSIEQLYKDNLHEHYGVLAEHFINGENFENGSNFCILAAKKAEKAGSLVDAITYKEKQIECLERSPKTKSLEKNIIDARTTLGLFCAQMGHFVKAKAICDPIIKPTLSSDYKKRISHIYLILGVYSLATTDDISKGMAYYKKVLKIGSELNDPLSLVLANAWMGQTLSMTCEFDKALYCLTKALEINVAANSQWGITAVKSWIARNYFYQGNIDLAHRNSLEALRIADDSGDIFSKAHAYTLLGLSFYGKGSLEEAKEHALKGIYLSEKIKLIFVDSIANNCLAEIYFALREYEESQKHWQREIAILRDNFSNPSRINSCKLGLLRANSMINTNIDLESMYALYYDIKEQVSKSDAQRYIGEILLVLDDSFLSKAEDWIKKAIEFDKRNGMMFYLARDYVLYSELFKRKEDFPKVKENLSKAIEIFKECGADGWVEKYKKELAAF
jgi:tetratricopeptide (TPR) repeat protein